MLAVEATDQCGCMAPKVAGTAIKLLLSLLQSHLPGGCIIDIRPLNCHWLGGFIVLPCETLLVTNRVVCECFRVVDNSH